MDDFLFLVIEWRFIEGYNTLWKKKKTSIEQNGGRLKKGGHFWYRGDMLLSDSFEEFAEDMSMPLKNLSQLPKSTPEDSYLVYTMSHVDAISEHLGIPWERSKDVPFGPTVPFIGFVWDIDRKRVSLQEEKKLKYQRAIEEWKRRDTHTLEDVQKLYGKLLHTCLIVPEGWAYLTKLESMLSIFHLTPYKPRHLPHHTDRDLLWWSQTLSKPALSREIPGAQEIVDVRTFSDASSSIEIGIVIHDRWRAWTFKPGWNSDGQDITWAKAVGMELLI